MKYYVIVDNNILISESADVLIQFYNNSQPLPEDYIEGKYIVKDGELVPNENYEAEQAEKEKERIAKLTMTPLDFINFLVSTGLTLEQINEYLETHLDVKMQLTYCQYVYCGVACSLMPISIGDKIITEDMVVEAFKKKYGE